MIVTDLARIARPDTRWQTSPSAYAERCMHEAYGHPCQTGIAAAIAHTTATTTTTSWMGGLVGQAAESSHPGSGDLRLPAKGAGAHRPGKMTMIEIEEDAGPAMHQAQGSDTEKARCANTGLLRRSLDWMSSGTRLDRRQTA